MGLYVYVQRPDDDKVSSRVATRTEMMELTSPSYAATIMTAFTGKRATCIACHH
eukprot:SAG31_NODE_6578_length_1965_cov_1.351018_3_plen_54_part_00